MAGSFVAVAAETSCFEICSAFVASPTKINSSAATKSWLLDGVGIVKGIVTSVVYVCGAGVLLGTVVNGHKGNTDFDSEISEIFRERVGLGIQIEVAGIAVDSDRDALVGNRCRKCES